MKALVCDRRAYIKYANKQGKAYGNFMPVTYKGTPVVYDHEVKGEKYIDVDPSDSKYFSRFKPDDKSLDKFAEILQGAFK